MKKYNLLPINEFLKKERKDPYIFTISKNDRHIYYIGFKHLSDPEHPDFLMIDRYWNDFMSKTGGNNCVVLIEGNLRAFVNSKETMIKRSGEGGYATYLATKNNIPVYCPEPPLPEELKILKQKFSGEHILLFYYIRWVNFFYKRNKEDTPDNIFQKALTNLKDYLKGTDIDVTSTHINKIYFDLFGNDMNKTELDEIRKLVFPIPGKTVINDIAVEDILIRDQWIVGQIEQLWEKEKNIFIVYGQTHAHLQEPAIREFVNNKE
jgi:hypothetical protein